MNKRTLSINICFITIMASILYLHVGSFFSYSYYASMFEDSSNIVILLFDLSSLVYSPITLIMLVGIFIVSFIISIGVKMPFLHRKEVRQEKINYSIVWMSVVIVSFYTLVNYLMSASIMMEMDNLFNTYSFFESTSNSSIFTFMSLLIVILIMFLFIISLVVVIKNRNSYFKKGNSLSRTLVMYILSIIGVFMAMLLYHKAFFIKILNAHSNLSYKIPTSYITSGYSGSIIKGISVFSVLVVLGLLSYLCIDWIKSIKYRLDILKLKKQEVRKDLNLTYEKRIVEDPIDFNVVGTVLVVLLLFLTVFMSQINDIYTTLAFDETFTSIKFSVWFIANNILPIACLVGVIVGLILSKRRNP